MWELHPLKQILRRGLRANAFDQTDGSHLSSAARTCIAQPHPKSGIEEDQNGEIIILSSSPIDVTKTKAKDVPRLDAACQVEKDILEPIQSSSSHNAIDKNNASPATTTSSSSSKESTSTVPPPPTSTSPPPSPPQESSKNEAKEEQGWLGLETEAVEESVEEDNECQSYYQSEFSAGESESLNETTATATLPPPPPSEDETNDGYCRHTEESADDSKEYDGSFDSLSLSSND